MQRKYSIVLILSIALFLIALSYGYEKEYEYVKEQARLEEEEKSMVVQGSAEKGQIFYLKPLNGYVVVYLENEETVFEYTNIKLSDLPKEVQDEITEGKKLNGLEKLYGFLENYSS